MKPESSWIFSAVKRKFTLERMIGGSRNLGVIWQQSSICGAYTTRRVGATSLRGSFDGGSNHELSSRVGIDFAGRGEGRGGKSQGRSALGSGASILVHLDTSQALISYFGLPQVSFPSIIPS